MAGLGPSSFQYFVFDFHVSPDVMFDKIIKISVSVAQAALWCRLEKVIPLDGPTIRRQPHVQTHSWQAQHGLIWAPLACLTRHLCTVCNLLTRTWQPAEMRARGVNAEPQQAIPALPNALPLHRKAPFPRKTGGATVPHGKSLPCLA